MSEVKVGDRVRAIHDDRDRRLEGKIGTVVEVEGFCVGVDFDSEIVGHTCGGLARMGHGWYLPDYYLEYVGRCNEYNKVIITVEDKVTTATLMKGRLVLGTAKARCSPNDRFDPLVGAQIAIQRLAKQFGSKLVVNDGMFDDNIEVVN